MAKAGDWMSVGFGKHIDKAAKESTGKQPTRFWMPPDPDEERQIILLDDEPVCFWEHSLKIDGSWKGNEFVCRKGHPDDPRCPLCMSKTNRYYIGFLTILDHTGWIDDDGNEHKNLRRLFPMKMETLKIFRKKKKQKKSLVGWKIEVSRTGKKTPACGNMFEFIEKVDPFEDEEFFYESRVEGGLKAPEPFDYREIFKPLSVDEMMMIGGGSGGGKSGGKSSGKSGDGGDDDTPY